ncbi:Protein of unknown function [Cotesia congregata]|uniref:Uncharacterized protein n=1 Tax=Cotesia congregata TaxID=51543 RepID=A0A8J2HF49_COTCN|nr:Protein of unknown function [Cotesia congregata]
MTLRRVATYPGQHLCLESVKRIPPLRKKKKTHTHTHTTYTDIRTSPRKHSGRLSRTSKRQHPLKTRFSKNGRKRYKMDPELNPTTAGNSPMYQAIEEDKLEDLILLLKNGMDVNEPIITTGEFAGFTALHMLHA